MLRFSRGVRHRLVLSHGSPPLSQLRNGVSILILRWGGVLGLFLEMQQGSQISLSVVTGNSEFHSTHCHGISPFVELRGNMMSFQITAEAQGSSRVSTSGTKQRCWCGWNIGITLQSKNENQPRSRDDLGYLELSQVAAVTSGFL